MAIDNLTINESAPQVDTLKFLDTELAKDAPTETEEVDRTTPAKVDEETDEPEDKLKLTDDDQEADVTDEIDFRPSLTKKDLVAAYPDILKKFPQLERAIYRERQFSELFPTIADAKTVIERAETLTNAETSLFKGEISDILDSVKSQDKEAFYRIVDNFLPTLDKLDRGAYLNILGNVGKSFVKSMKAEGDRFGKDTDQGKLLSDTALILYQFLFGNSNWQEPTSLAKPISEDDKKVSNREQELLQQRFNEVKSDLDDRATNAVKSTIIQYIDPKESMSAYVKDKAIDDCGNQLQSQILQDKNFLSKMDSLWKAAYEARFSKSSLEKIKSTYYAKAQTLLPEIIKSVRAKALSGTAKVTKRAVEKEDNPRVDTGRSASNKSGQDNKPKPRESTKDYLNRTLGE